MRQVSLNKNSFLSKMKKKSAVFPIFAVENVDNLRFA